MADVTYRFLFESTGGSSSSSHRSSVARTTSGEDVEETSVSRFVRGIEAIRKMAPVGYALKFANQAITAEINRVELRTGNALLQEKISYAYSTTGRVLTIGGAIIGGALTGNPLAVAGGVMSAISWGVDIAQEQTNINLARRVENIGIGMANIRAGAGGNRNGSTVDY